MTETEWLTSDDPIAMLESIRLRAGAALNDYKPWGRKLRLFSETGCEECRTLTLGMGFVRAAEYVAGADCGTRIEKAAIIRDIFGNPFMVIERRHKECWSRPRNPKIGEHLITFHDAWLTWNDGTVPKLAQAIYDERAFERLPILADALEESGCDKAEILNHCRGIEQNPQCRGEIPSHEGDCWIPLRGPHVRGCWVIDLILGKQ